jgi:class 3 adenylate cyclase/tetratricopeptide (TPR) repeat protein
MPCPHCGRDNPPNSSSCQACGGALTYTPRHLAEQVLVARAALEGERKQVTVLFCDVADSTPLAERLGPEGMHALLTRFFELAVAEVHRYGGTVNQFLGDGFMALFGAPVAHEDHARRAVLAAVAIQRALGAEVAPAIALRTRVGLNTGVVVVGAIGDNLRMDYTAIGDTTHLAARLQHLAEPGTTLVSETTWRSVEGDVDGVALGLREVKGLPPQRVFRVNHVRADVVRFDAALRRGLTPLVGRRRELEALENSYRTARRGRVRVVNLVGEAGIGKSRILYELERRLEDEQVCVLHGHCSAYGSATAFLPFIEVIRDAFRLGRDAGRGEIERTLREGLPLLGMKPDALPFFLNLLGLDPDLDAFLGLDGEIVGARTREALQDLVRARCRLSSVLLVLDDLHWTDTASEELVASLTRTIEPLPLLIVCAFRPEYRAPWGSQDNAVRVDLAALSQESSLDLVQRRLGVAALPAELAQLIVDKSEGNPLFAEELTRYLSESGALRREDDQITFDPAAEVPVPATLHDLIMARVDRLPEGARTVLQLAAVIGRRFAPELVRLLAGHEVHRQLDILEAQELITRREGEASVTEYAFRHVLIQDSVYASLLSSRRRSLHQQVAEAIEGDRQPERLGEWAEILAHHWSQTARADKAVRYLALAGQKSLLVYSLDEAEARFRRVLELMEADPDAGDDAFLGDVLLSWVRLYYYRKDFKGLIALVERYLPRVEALGPSRRLALLLFWLGFSHTSAARAAVAGPLLERALALGESLGDDECIGYACVGLTWLYAYWAPLRLRAEAERVATRGLSIADKLGDIYMASKLHGGLATLALMTGRHDRAGELGHRILELGRRAGDPRTVAMGLWVTAFVDVQDERFEAATQKADECERISPDPMDRLTALGARGAALALMGRAREGLETLREVRRDMIAGEFLFPLVGLDVTYGVALVLDGKLAAGVRWLEESLGRYQQWGNTAAPALVRMALGEIFVRMAGGDERPPLTVMLRNAGFLARALPTAARRARRELDAAIAMSRDADLPATLARSLWNLARLCQAKNRVAEARRYLEEAHRIAAPHATALARMIQNTLATLLSVDEAARPRG